ncbi:MAG: alpha/beta hydrolase [Chloroflexi bacterium]|nr:alpha/beta hydrolase [Chloroflexota bacterium]
MRKPYRLVPIVCAALALGVISLLWPTLFRTGLAAIEDQFLYLPSRTLVATPAQRGLGYEEVWLTASDGVRLHGWFVPGPRDLVWLWLHGNGGNISHRVENIAFIQRRLGASVFIFDYRGYGLSEGRPSEDGLYRDADAALAYLRIRPDLDARRVVLFGRSLGTAVAVDLAARERVLGLILESPLTSIPGLARALYPFLPLEPLLRTRYDALAKIGRVAAPLLVIHSRDDEVIPYQQGQALFAAAREPKRLYTLTGARHNDTYLRGGDGYWQALDGFLASLQSR